MKGIYVLILQLDESRLIPVGRLGPLSFSRGFYAYAGSAMNGLEMRIGRHLKQHKKFHWHIDYLREKARIIDVMLIPAEKKYECDLATALGKDLTCIRSFGSSDCQCPGHLFFADNEKDIVKAVHAKLSEIGLTYWPLYSKDSLGL